MKPCLAILLLAMLAAPAARAEIQTDWAYHSAGDEGRLADKPPGADVPFLANGTDRVPDGETITLYVLTAHDFAGSLDEQIFVRWWDGAMSHWIMGAWVANLTLDAARPETCFRGLPTEGSIGLDLWKVEIPPWITQPGENFYAIQLKGYADGTSEERYLLSRLGGDFCHINHLGQIWSASEEFDGQDWIVHIVE